MKKPRLDQLLRRSGLVKTRAEAHSLIKKGRLKVDGKIITNPAYQTRPNKHNITIDDKPLQLPTEKVYFILNKPVGISCQQGEHPNVIEFIKIDDEKIKNSLFSVGRLDVDTSGLLIITNDGKLAHKILDPENKIWKTYVVITNKKISEENICKIKKGITVILDKKKYTCMPAQIKSIGESTYKIKIREGKKRQIRRMMEAAGVKVLKLKRIAIGGLFLPENLKEGEFREINKDVILSIFKK